MFNTSETSGNALPEVSNLTNRWVCDSRARAVAIRLNPTRLVLMMAYGLNS
jgi:hypothetical protein